MHARFGHLQVTVSGRRPIPITSFFIVMRSGAQDVAVLAFFSKVDAGITLVADIKTVQIPLLRETGVLANNHGVFYLLQLQSKTIMIMFGGDHWFTCLCEFVLDVYTSRITAYNQHGAS